MNNQIERARILTAISKADGLINGTWLGINEPGHWDKQGAIQNINEAKILLNKATELIERMIKEEHNAKIVSCNHKFPKSNKQEYGFMGKGICELCGYSDY